VDQGQRDLSSDARNGGSLTAFALQQQKQLSAILSTSQSLQKYSVVQDLVARSLVEAIGLAVTDGAALGNTVRNVTRNALFAEIKSAPKLVFTLAAQRGLEDAASQYHQLSLIQLPPTDATVLSAPDLSVIRNLYIRARSEQLPFEALAAKLMPTSGVELAQQGFQSVVSEMLPVSGSADLQVVTFRNVLDLEKQVAALGNTQTALQSYRDNLNLALGLAEANDAQISSWASSASARCGQN
jgi:hypothetical protein